MDDALHAEMMPLTTFARGEQARISVMHLNEPDAQRLRDLGICEGCQVRIVMNTDKCVLGLKSCRVALRRDIAMCLFAESA